MGDAQIRIMRMATASSKFKEDKIEEASYDSYEVQESFVVIRCCGNEIPNWFSHKSEGCSIKIELPRDWFSTDFLGFALSLVVATTQWIIKIGCKYNFKTSNGESHEVNHPSCYPFLEYDFGSRHLHEVLEYDLGSRDSHEVLEYDLGSRDSHEVFVWWSNNVFEEVVEGAQSPTAFYKLVTEVNVDFTEMAYFGAVEKCGICLLYGKDAEMIKQRAL